MFLDLNYNKEIPKPNLFLAKPNRNIISPIETEVELKQMLKEIDELHFKIPLFIEESSSMNNNLKILRNPLLSKIKERYLIKVQYMNEDKWFIVINPKKEATYTGNDVIEYRCMSLEYELKDKKINYQTDSSNISQILKGNYKDNIPHGVLCNSSWELGYLDEYYNDVYRSISYNGDLLGLLNEISNVFDAIIQYDTENKLINIYYKYNFGKDTGIVFNYRKYLKNVSKDTDASSMAMCTRLECYGKDNLSIENINPTGKNYIDDFSYFMYPFEIKNGTIVKHSDYMSDELCVAITKYKAKILLVKDKFRNLIETKNTYDKLLLYKKDELRSLKHQLAMFSDKYQVATMSGDSIQPIVNIEKDINKDIEAKKIEIQTYENRLNKIKNEIYNIRCDLDENANFTNMELDELDSFIIVDKWQGNDYIDDKDLYRDGIKKLKEKCKPKISLTLDYVDFMKCIEEQNMWGKIKVGDKIGVEYPLLDIHEKVNYGESVFTPEESEV